jgi:hypothetical protein
MGTVLTFCALVLSVFPSFCPTLPFDLSCWLFAAVLLMGGIDRGAENAHIFSHTSFLHHWLRWINLLMFEHHGYPPSRIDKTPQEAIMPGRAPICPDRIRKIRGSFTRKFASY